MTSIRLRTAALALWRRWGWPGSVGAALLLASAVIGAVLVPRAQADVRTTEAAVREARTAAATARRQQTTEVAAGSPAQRFRSGFPDAALRHRRVTQMLTLAAGMGLQPRRSEIRSVDEAALGLARVRVVLPLAGPYESLRRFVDQALRDDPAASLDLMRIERSGPLAGEFRAELHWSLWMLPGDAAVPARVRQLAQSHATGAQR